MPSEELVADPTASLDDSTVKAASAHIAEEQAHHSDVRIDEDPIDPTEEEKKTFLGLKPTQVLGGALASCTAAVLGGQLGVAGTVAGAALTSVTIAVGGAAYTQSIDKTRSGLDSVRRRFRLADTTPTTVDEATPPTLKMQAGADRTTAAGSSAAAGPSALRNADTPTESEATSWHRRISPAKVFASAAAVFLLAGVILTGVEGVRGGSVSGGEGTTVGQISRGDVTTSRGAAESDSDNGYSREQDVSERRDSEGNARPEPATQPTTGSTGAPQGSTEPQSPSGTTQDESSPIEGGSESGSGTSGSTGTDSPGTSDGETSGTSGAEDSGTSGSTGSGSSGSTGSGSGSSGGSESSGGTTSDRAARGGTTASGPNTSDQGARGGAS